MFCEGRSQSPPPLNSIWCEISLYCVCFYHWRTLSRLYMAQYCPAGVAKNATISPLAGIEPVQTLNLWRDYQQRKLKARNW